jgi:hypothetical protein
MMMMMMMMMMLCPQVSANYAAAIKGTTDVILGGAQYNRQQ